MVGLMGRPSASNSLPISGEDCRRSEGARGAARPDWSSAWTWAKVSSSMMGGMQAGMGLALVDDLTEVDAVGEQVEQGPAVHGASADGQAGAGDDPHL